MVERCPDLPDLPKKDATTFGEFYQFVLTTVYPQYTECAVKDDKLIESTKKLQEELVNKKRN